MLNSSKPVMVYHHCTQATDAQGIHIYEMCRAFSKLGWQVEKVALVKEEIVVTKKSTTSHLGWIQRLPIWIIELIKILYNIPEVWRLWLAIRKYKPKFIYERNALFNVAGVIVAQWTNTPIIVEVNSPLVQEQKNCNQLFWKNIAQFLETWIIKKSFKTIAVTQVLKNILIENGAPAEKIAVIYNGVNLEEYPAEKFASIRNFSPCKIGFVGWFRDWHHLPDLLSVLTQENIFANGVKLFLIGDGPARPDIEKAIIKYKAHDKVIITGPLNRQEVLDELMEMTIAIQPAANIYACPMKLIEYMAAGRAIIAPDLPNIREILCDSINGLLFKDGDWHDLSHKISRLLNDPLFAQKLGQNARLTILEKLYTWCQNALETLKILGL